jgi:peptidoglycan/xylan/chitin deacetylase (PgdA/CDA1 family)
MTKKKVIVRIDDIGASSKQYEQYGKSPLRFGKMTLPIPFILNWGFMKRMPGIKGWGPYREMTAAEWESVCTILEEYDAKMTVCVTAAWVEADGSLTPFPEKFPEEAAALKHGVEKGLLEIGNHGLTHCVVGKHLPQLWRGNRSMHREFWDWLPEAVHAEHLETAQAILQDYFGKVTTLTPPGNQWAEYTEKAAHTHGLRVLSARFPSTPRDHSLIWADQHETYAFHDRELVLEGTAWLIRLLESLASRNEQACTVKELYATK